MNINIKNNIAEFIDLGTIGISQLDILFNNHQALFDAIGRFNDHLDWKYLINDLIYLVMIRFAIKTKHQKYL